MSKKLSLIMLFCACVNFTQAQALYDANWTFGYKGGINFSNLDSVYSFNTNALNHEATGCISDSAGNLLFYISEKKIGDIAYEILDKNGIRFSNNDNIKSNHTITNGFNIFPLNYNKYIILHSSIDSFYNTTPYLKIHLYFTIVSHTNNILHIDTINIPLHTNTGIDEKVTAVKHADGKSWWIIVSELIDTNNNTCINKKIRYLLKDNGVINGPYYQNIGSNLCNAPGEMKSSYDGNKLCSCINGNKIDLYSINRCTGEFSLIQTFITNEFVYSCEFSKNEQILYYTIANQRNNGTRTNNSYLMQLNLLTNQANQIWNLVSLDTSIFQIEIARNGKIYVSLGSPSISVGTYSYNKNKINNLSVINFPDSSGQACGFQPYQFQLQDSSRSTYGLPNFPNYNLGALSIYEADAGRDTIICTDSTISQKVVQLGSPTINGVQYQWYPNYNLSSDTAAQVLAYPDTSTMYYVMLSDTSIKNACKTRLDSVLVEVKNCVTGINDPQTPKGGLRVYPNPASQEINISINNLQSSIKEVKVYDVAGRIVHSQLPIAIGSAVHSNVTKINLGGLEMGLYFIEVMLSNGSEERVKFIKQ